MISSLSDSMSSPVVFKSIIDPNAIFFVSKHRFDSKSRHNKSGQPPLSSLKTGLSKEVSKLNPYAESFHPMGFLPPNQIFSASNHAFNCFKWYNSFADVFTPPPPNQICLLTYVTRQECLIHGLNLLYP